MTKETYEALDALLKSRKVEDEAEDILLEMAECLADQGKLNVPLKHSETFGRIAVTVTGICEQDEDDPEETAVYIKTLKAEGREFEIEEYIL